MEPEIKVTKIKNRWHARLIEDGKVHSEMACDLREDIGYLCRNLLRWYDKCGGVSIYAHKSRQRWNSKQEANRWYPVGRVWHSGYFLTDRTKT
jgi:hypothetical protein